MQPIVLSPSRGPRDTAGRPRPPLRYTIDAAAGVVFVDLLYIQHPAAVVAGIRAIRHDSAYRPEFGTLLECCYLRGVPTSEGIRELARACFAGCRPELASRVAIVAAGQASNAGARFFAILTGAPREQLRVFGVFSEALAWLCPQSADVAATREPSWAARAGLLHDAARRARLGQA